MAGDTPTSKTPADRWRTWRRRIVLAALFAGVLLLAETLAINSPVFLVDALYHARETNMRTISRMPPEKRERMLQRLAWVLDYYRCGSADNPYAYTTGPDCGPSAAPGK